MYDTFKLNTIWNSLYDQLVLSLEEKHDEFKVKPGVIITVFLRL